MRNSLMRFAVGALLVGPCLAQVPPGISKDMHDNKVLTTGPGGNIPSSGFSHLAFFRLPGDGPGVWTTCISVEVLAAKWGGKGGDDVLIGKYDRVRDTFTPTTHAAALNTSGTDDSLMIDERTGRYAVIERSDAFYFAHRARPGLAFSAPVAIRGLTATIIKDFENPALGWVDGKLHLFWAQSFVYRTPLDISNLAAPSVTSVKSNWIKVTNNGLVEQPVPLMSPEGDIEGLLGIHKPGGSDTDLTFMEDLDPSTPDHTIFDTMGFTDGGGVCGSLICAADRPFDKKVRQIQVSWLLGETEAIGNTMEIFGATAKVGANAPLTVVLFAVKPLATGISLPGRKGKFALDLATTLVLGTMSHPTATEQGVLSFKLPNAPALRGVRGAIQGLSIDPVAATQTFTNTAWIAIK